MSRHHYCKRHGFEIEVADAEGRILGEAKELLFTDYSDKIPGGAVFGTIVFRRNMPTAPQVNSIYISGTDNEDNPFVKVLEEVVFAEEPNGPGKNHYSFRAGSLLLMRVAPE